MRALLVAAMVAAVTLAGSAQDSIDDLFEDPEAGIIEDEPDETVDIEGLTEQDAPSVSGSASAEAGVSTGLSSWNNNLPVTDRLDFSAFYAMKSRVRFDVRPTSATRFYVSLSAEAPSQGSVTFGSIGIDELFLDYTFRESVFFKVGLQTMTWGNGQLFNPANLVTATSNAITLRGYLPLGASGLTLAAIAKDGFFTDPAVPGIAEVGYAGLFDWNLSPLSGSVAAYYQVDSGARTSVSFKAPIAGVDVALDGVVDWADDLADNGYQALLSTFWEGTDAGLNVVAEYLFESDRLPDGLGSRVAMGIAATDLLPRWNPGVRWFHAFYDTSGEVIVGADGPIADNLRMSLALPISYGAPGTTYRSQTEDPAGRAIALIARVSLSVNF